MSARAIFHVKINPKLEMNNIWAEISIYPGKQGEIVVRSSDIGVGDIFEAKEEKSVNEVVLLGLSSRLPEVPSLNIYLPGDTELHITGSFPVNIEVRDYVALKLGGQQRANVFYSGNNNGNVSAIAVARIECEDQSSCCVEGITGKAQVISRGQSEVYLSGVLTELEVLSEDQSFVSLLGHVRTLVHRRKGNSRILINRVSVEEFQKSKKLREEKIRQCELDLAKRRSVITRSA